MTNTLTFAVENLNCASCVARVETALAKLPEICAAQVNLATSEATVTTSAAPDAKTLAAATAAAGYPARQVQTVLTLSGLNCASCVRRAEQALGAVPGVVAAQVNLATAQAHVTAFSGVTSAALMQAVGKAGYPGTLHDAAPEAPPNTLRRDAALAIMLALPVFILEMGGHLFPAFHHVIARTIGHTSSWTVQAILTTLILAGPGRRFFTSGIPALLRGAPEMNALVALGTSAAWGYSMVVLLAPRLLPADARNVYFEAAAVICALILLGRYFEHRAKGRSGAAIKRLMGLQARTAQVKRDDLWVDLPLEAVQIGDILRARPGERLASDGVVIAGNSFVDESMMTGEPRAISKAAGDVVTGGTVNGSGALEYRATAVGETTVLAQIIRMVQAAQGGKLPVQALVDRIAGVFVPAVLVIAALTVLGWLLVDPSRALVAGVAVLIVACPCAMGLAVPTSIMVGTGRGAELGVLFRKGEALQHLHQARVVAFDKTGTLTEGRPALTSQSWVDAEVLPLIAAVEAQSEHPIAKAITAAVGPVPEAQNVTATPGMGIAGDVDGQRVLVGSALFFTEQGIKVDASLQHDADSFAAQGETPVFAAVDGRAVAALGIADPVKGSALQAVRDVQARGAQVVMISGDARVTAEGVAQQLGITDVVAEVLPADKRERVQDLQAKYGKTVFVGDGINDAPALAQADTGVALGTGTDVAMETADVVLMSGDLAAVPRAIGLSHAVMRNIRQNLFWAFAYNIALIPVAAMGLLSPMLAAGAMALSSVLVISNALRLARYGKAAP